MRRNATKVAAAVLSLAVTMTSISLPTTAAAAKKVKLNKTKATLRVGKTTTLKVTKGGKKVKATFTSNKKKIATVGKKTGKVKAKKKGTCTITAKYAGKKYKCKITVKKKVTSTATAKPSTAPTTAPTQTPAPTTAPTATPAPTTAPTQTPAALTIASASAIAADTIQVNLSAPLPDGATLKLAKKGSTGTVNFKQELDAEKKVAKLKGDANYATGTYVVTLTSGGKDVASVEVAVEAQRVDKIEILNKDKIALTSTDRKSLYVYYDVKDQYGNSIKEKTTINWSSSTGRISTNDKSKGCLTLVRAHGEQQDEQFKYNDPVYIIGVDTKSGKSVEEKLSVGMARALAEVDFVGFVDTKANSNQIVQKLPVDFAKNRYRLLYRALDQEKQELPAADYITGANNSKVTFTVNKYDLVKSQFNDGKTYTVNGKEYCSVLVNPGIYVDKGGDVTFTAISNTTGVTTAGNYNVGEGLRLKSLVLEEPSKTIADGDTDITIPYTATAVNAKGETVSVKNYETIVRSTNKLKLNASEGQIKVRQKADGTAEIVWSDSKITANKYSRAHYFGTDNTSANDNMDRTISLSTIVIGGDNSSVTTLRVADARRPVSIDTVPTNDVVAEKGKLTINLFGSDDVTYRDQYGEILDKEKAEAFFMWTGKDKNENVFKTKYGIRVDYSSALGEKNNINTVGNNSEDDIYATSDIKNDTYIQEYWNYISNNTTKDKRLGRKIYLAQYSKLDPNSKSGLAAKKNDATDVDEKQTNLVLSAQADYAHKKDSKNLIKERNIKYSIVREDEDNNTNDNPNAGYGSDERRALRKASSNEWSAVSNEKNVVYTVASIQKLSDLRLKFKDDKNKVRIQTDYSNHLNGEALSGANLKRDDVVPATSSVLTDNRKVSVVGSYNGKEVTVPDSYYAIKYQMNDYDQVLKLNKDCEIVKGTELGKVNETVTGEAALKFGDLYNFNDAKNTRKWATRQLSILVYKDKAAADNVNNLVSTVASSAAIGDNAKKSELVMDVRGDVMITDASRSFGEVKITKDDKEVKSIDLSATNTVIDLTIDKDKADINKKLQDYTVKVYDDCGDEVAPENYSLRCTVGNYKESNTVVTEQVATDNKYTHLPNSNTVEKNNTTEAKINGAEIGDTFNLKIFVAESGNASVEVPVTVGADKLANMYYDSGSNYTSGIKNDKGEDVFYNEFDEGDDIKFGDDLSYDLRDTLGYDR